jgi:hypothetical protein
MVVKSGRKIIGFDLVEVGDSKNGWDANVGSKEYLRALKDRKEAEIKMLENEIEMLKTGATSFLPGSLAATLNKKELAKKLKEYDTKYTDYKTGYNREIEHEKRMTTNDYNYNSYKYKVDKDVAYARDINTGHIQLKGESHINSVLRQRTGVFERGTDYAVRGSKILAQKAWSSEIVQNLVSEIKNSEFYKKYLLPMAQELNYPNLGVIINHIAQGGESAARMLLKIQEIDFYRKIKNYCYNNEYLRFFYDMLNSLDGGTIESEKRITEWFKDAPSNHNKLGKNSIFVNNSNTKNREEFINSVANSTRKNVKSSIKKYGVIPLTKLFANERMDRELLSRHNAYIDPKTKKIYDRETGKEVHFNSSGMKFDNKKDAIESEYSGFGGIQKDSPADIRIQEMRIQSIIDKKFQKEYKKIVEREKEYGNYSELDINDYRDRAFDMSNTFGDKIRNRISRRERNEISTQNDEENNNSIRNKLDRISNSISDSCKCIAELKAIKEAIENKETKKESKSGLSYLNNINNILINIEKNSLGKVINLLRLIANTIEKSKEPKNNNLTSRLYSKVTESLHKVVSILNSILNEIKGGGNNNGFGGTLFPITAGAVTLAAGKNGVYDLNSRKEELNSNGFGGTLFPVTAGAVSLVAGKNGVYDLNSRKEELNSNGCMCKNELNNIAELIKGLDFSFDYDKLLSVFTSIQFKGVLVNAFSESLNSTQFLGNLKNVFSVSLDSAFQKLKIMPIFGALKNSIDNLANKLSNIHINTDGLCIKAKDYIHIGGEKAKQFFGFLGRLAINGKDKIKEYGAYSKEAFISFLDASKKYWENSKEGRKEFYSKIGDFFSYIFKGAKEIMINSYKAIAPKLAEGFTYLSEKIKGFGKVIGESYSKLKEKISSLNPLNMLKNLKDRLVSSLGGVFGKVFNGLKTLTGGALKWAGNALGISNEKKTLKTVIQIKNILSAIYTHLTGNKDYKSVENGTIRTHNSQSVSQKIQSAIDEQRDKLDFKKGFSVIKNKLISIDKSMTEEVKETKKKEKKGSTFDFGKTLMKVAGMIGSLVTGIFSFGKNILGTIATLLPFLAGGAGRLVGGAVKGIGAIAGGVGRLVPKAAMGAGAVAGGVGTIAGGAGRAVLSGARMIPGIGLAVGAGMALYDGVQGWGKAGERFGVSQDKATLGQKTSSTLGSILTLGLSEDAATSVAKFIHGVGSTLGKVVSGIGDCIANAVLGFIGFVCGDPELTKKWENLKQSISEGWNGWIWYPQ